jgi:hypothetical protein
MAALTGMAAQGSRRRKNLPGLPAESDEDDDDSKELGGLSGARGTAASEGLRRSMARNARQYRLQLEANLLRVTKKDTLRPKHLLKYSASHSPLGNKVEAGYLVTILCMIHHHLAFDEPETARLLSILGVALAGQASLDQGWHNAWRLYDFDEPPFQSWRQLEAGRIQKLRAHDLLLEKSWLAAVVAEAKDDDYLAKRRGKGKGTSSKTDPKEDA